VTFKPGKEMEERVRQLEEEAARAAAQQPVEQEVTAARQATGAPPAAGQQPAEGSERSFGTAAQQPAGFNA
jgi:hypothetical protein